MKTIKTQETLVKVLKQEGNRLYVDKELYDMSKAYVIDLDGKIIYEVISYAYMPLIGIENKRKIWNNKTLRLELNELTSYVKKIQEKQQKQERKEKRKEVCEAIEYFNGWQEGDNITITADFIKYAEILKELL